MTQHFETLWEQCEKLHQEDQSSAPLIMEELIMKLNVYKTLSAKTEIPEKELQEMKLRIFGEILLGLTNLSSKDNINVFDALLKVYNFASIEHYAAKYN